MFSGSSLGKYLILLIVQLCKYGDVLVLCACPKCGALAAIYCEEGRVFLAIRNPAASSEEVLGLAPSLEIIQ